MLRAILQRFPPLARYNQILWAIVGTGMVIGVLSLLAVGATALIVSLWNSHRGGIQVAVIEDDPAKGAATDTARYDFCQPLLVRDSSYQLILVVSDQFAVRKVAAKPALLKMAAYDSYGEAPMYYGACEIYGGGRQSGTVNVLIRNADDNSMHLLLKENAIINRLEYPQPASANHNQDHEFPQAGMLYWEITLGDSNHDNRIDDGDDMGAYLSDPDGSRLERITPTPSRVLEKSYDAKRKLLLMRILPDTNHDNTLDDKDKPALIEVDVARRKMTREVLDSAKLADTMHQAEPKRQSR